MKRLARALLLLLALGCLGAGPAPPAGLELKLELVDARTPTFRLSLVNRGSHTHQVVRPGDGSDVGWREPAIRWSGEVYSEGRWVAVPLRSVGRCGNYAANWHADVVELAPGGKLEFAWGNHPIMLNLPEHGRIRLVARYEYAAGQNSKNGQRDPGPMGSQPPYELVSEPLVFQR